MRYSYGLIGEKLGHSISPLIHQLIFDFINLNGSYKLFEMKREELPSFIKNTNLEGFNITIPYKLEIMNYLDYISDEAKRIGAVNTVSIKDNKFYGYNTDYHGIDITFKKHNINLDGASAVILGSGGASAAVLQYLRDMHCSEITIVVRDKNKIDSMKFKDFNILTYEEIAILPKKDVLINCTPVGMSPNIDQSPVPSDFVEKFSFVFDLIYNPLKTKLLTYAERNNIKNTNGLLMLIGQAVQAEVIWNNILTTEDLIDMLYDKLSQRGI